VADPGIVEVGEARERLEGMKQLPSRLKCNLDVYIFMTLLGRLRKKQISTPKGKKKWNFQRKILF
jgi:hypothetical protein